MKAMSFTGLNEKVAEIVEKKFKNKNIKILVLGAGEGYLESILLKKGFKDITSVDYFTNFKLKEKCKFIRLDLNLENFAEIIKKQSRKEYDVILAVEVIEHLFSPFNFLKNIKELLSNKGIAIITTPNIHSSLSRIHTLLFGYPLLFLTDPSIGDHISPIFHNVFILYLNTLNLNLIKVIHYGSPIDYIKNYQTHSFKSYFYKLILLINYIILSPLVIYNRELGNGIITIYIITK